MSFFFLSFLFLLPLTFGKTEVWPLPQNIMTSGDPIPLSSEFQIQTKCDSVYVRNTIQRYKKFISVSKETKGLALLTIECDSNSQDFGEFISTNYVLKVSEMSATIHSDTPYGAIYGIETFSQLVINGSLIHSTIGIIDSPVYLHRGVMIDTGRRFFPISTIKNLLDGMLYTKLNVLHWHLTDWCRASFESEKYPMLTSGLVGMHLGSYNHSTVRDIIEYAKERGIRVIPEVDIPGHSLGFAPLAELGMQFCDDQKGQMYADAENKTLTILKNYFLEIMSVFPEPYIHIGGDETENKGRCTTESFKLLEEQIFEFLQSKGKRPIGWEEILYASKSAKSYNVINGWLYHTAHSINNDGYDAIESHLPYFYLDHTDSNTLWHDLKTVNNLRRTNAVGRLLGGEVSMWTDQFLYRLQCGAFGDSLELFANDLYAPAGADFYDRIRDAEFHESILSLIFPRSIKAAGTFYRFDNSLIETSSEFKEMIKYHNDRIRERGVMTCPSECYCDETTKCGKKYIQ